MNISFDASEPGKWIARIGVLFLVLSSVGAQAAEPMAWGRNFSGQLCDGTRNNHYLPASMGGLSDVVAVKGSGVHSLALRSDGTILACGQNAHGELGDGTNNQSFVPVSVVDLDHVVKISAGGNHSTALKSDGTVWSWGINSVGQVGDSTTTDANRPRRVGDLSGVIAVSSGGSHSLALESDGTVWAWGGNFYGQLGDGTTNNSSVPVKVANLAGVIAIASGHNLSLALKSDGTVWAWGNNTSGQLGNGTTVGSSVPVQVSNLCDVIKISAGSIGLALKSDGTVWAWGPNSVGELGNGTNTPMSTVPVLVSPLANVVEIAAEGGPMALKSDGRVWTWGSNYDGQLGTGSRTDSNRPVMVSGLGNVVGIATGSGLGLALIGPKITFSTSAQDFGTVGVGSSGDAKIVTITNEGPGVLTLLSANLSGANPGDFLLSPLSLPAKISAGDKVTLGLRFSPTAAGARGAQLTIVSDAARSPHTIRLDGTGDSRADLGVGITATPNVVLVGGKLTYTLTVSNSGPATSYDVRLNDAVPQGTSFVSFTATQGQCSAPPVNGSGTLSCALGSLARGATATITMVVKRTALLRQIVNTATVVPGAASPDPNTANNAATITSR